MSTSTKKSFWKTSNAFTVLLLLGVVIGGILGVVLGPKAVIFKPIGQVFINLLFVVITPLVFFSIAGAISDMADMKRLGKLLGSTLGLFVFTGFIAATATTILVKVVNPSKNIVIANLPESGAKIVERTIGEHIVSMFTVSDFPDLLSKSNLLPFIVFAIFFGLGVAMLGEKGEKISSALNSLADVTFKMVGLLMKFAPIGLGAYFANMTGVFGPQLFGSLASLVLLYYPVALGYFFIFFGLYTYMAGGLNGTKAFFKNTFTASITALGTSSSAASIPFQRDVADRIGVPSDISGVVLPMGATMHMDGGAIGIIMRIYLCGILFNVPFNSFVDYAVAIALALLASTAVSAVPGGAIISSMLIINMMGYPPEALGILLAFGTLIDPIGTMVNSTGDTVVSMMVTRLLEGKGWMEKNLSGKQIKNW